MSTTASRNVAGLSLRANFLWTFGGNLVYAGCQWGMLVALARLTSPEMVGRFALGLAITAPVMMFANLQLRGVQATDARGEFQFEDYFGLRLITSFLALCGILGIVTLAGYRVETALVVLVIGLAKTFESISDVLYGSMQKQERMDRVARSMLIKGPASLAALCLLVILTGDVLWGAVGLALVWAALLIWFDIPQRAALLNAQSDEPRQIRPRWHAPTLARLVWLALPLGFVMMLISLNTNIPRYTLERVLGEADLGLFAAVAYLQTVGTTIMNALGQSASPRLSRYYAEGKKSAFRRLLLRLVGIAIGLGLAGLLIALVAGEWILHLIYGPTFAQQSLLVLIMASACLAYMASCMGYAMTAARYLQVQLPLYLMVTAATFIGCLIFVPQTGISGAAWALLLSNAVLLLGSTGIVLYALRKPAAPEASNA